MTVGKGRRRVSEPEPVAHSVKEIGAKLYAVEPVELATIRASAE